MQRIGLACLTLALGLAAPTPVLAQAREESHGRTTYWFPENVFAASRPVDALWKFIEVMTVGIGAAVFIALIYFLIKYRHKPGRHAKFIHGNNKLETVWTIVPAVILALTAAFSQTTWTKLKSPPPPNGDPDTVEVEVIGRQFQWYFRYPGKDGKLGQRNIRLINPTSSVTEELLGLDRSDEASKDDIITPHLVVPANKRVYIHLTSVDVLHSFFLPHFRIKQDAVPGIKGRVWFEAEKTSDQVIGNIAFDPETATDFEKITRGAKPFDIVCAELCGQAHYKMKGSMYVVTPAQYEAWLASEIEMLATEGEEY